MSQITLFGDEHKPVLKSKIMTVPLRERSGASSGSRFDFQKNWALTQILRLHLSGDDYVVVLDWHEDVLILDSETEPTSIKFYQVKGKKSGHWTLTDLLRREAGADGPKSSILGKLYQNRRNFEDQTESLNFISNAKYRFKLQDTSALSMDKNEICAFELLPDQLETIKQKLAREHELDELPDVETCMYFRCTDLSLDDHVGHTTGKVAEFLHALFPNRKFSTTPIYQALFTEVSRKNNFSQDVENFEALLRTKAISRSNINKILQTIGVTADLDDTWRQVENRLNTEGYPALGVNALKIAWRHCELERMDHTNEIVQSLHRAARASLPDLHEVATWPLMDILARAFYAYGENPQAPQGVHSDAYVKAAILMAIYEQQLQETYPQSSEEEA